LKKNLDPQSALFLIEQGGGMIAEPREDLEVLGQKDLRYNVLYEGTPFDKLRVTGWFLYAVG
jgi:hypothetical protein